MCVCGVCVLLACDWSREFLGVLIRQNSASDPPCDYAKSHYTHLCNAQTASDPPCDDSALSPTRLQAIPDSSEFDYSALSLAVDWSKVSLSLLIRQNPASDPPEY